MLQLVIAPDPRLRVKTKQVKKITPALAGTLKEMVKLTETFQEPEGVGLASTQVGLDERFFVSLWSSKKSKKKAYQAIINPKITKSSKKSKKFFEGCLSIPNIWGEIERPVWITVEYQDETGQTHREKLVGLKAHIFQHEIDHLEGTLFTQKVLEQKGKFYKFTGKDKQGEDIYEEITL